VEVWDVLARRREGDEWQVSGSVNAPDLDLAMMLVRETHFRHGEGKTFALRLRGDTEIRECPDPTGIGGVIDREYRRQDGYVGVGAKLKRVHALMADRGAVIDRPRPPARRVGRDRERAHG
jgi:1,2-phenylacetyl-CoA epoxidase PaaB subunit